MNYPVPGFNGKAYMGERTKITSGDQKIRNIDVERALDVMLQWSPQGKNDWKRGGAIWYEMTTGANITFLSEGTTSFYPSFMLDDFRLMVDSRITYIAKTTINHLYYNPGN